MNDLTIPTTQQRMTSLEIADLTKKRHDHVMRDIKSLIAQDAIAAPNFGGSKYKDSSGKMNPMFDLDFKSTMVLITGYDAKRRSIVVDRWISLETGQAQPAMVQKPASLLPIDREFRAAVRMAKAAGLKGNQAVLSANRLTKEMTGSDCLLLLGASNLVKKDQVQYFTPSYLGKQIGVSGKAVNQKLKFAGLQKETRDHKKRIVWVVTEKGMKFAELSDTGKKHKSNGSPVIQIKWAEAVLPLIKEAA